MRRRVPLIAAVAVALVAAAVARADWGTTTDLSATGQNATSQQVAANAAGTTIAVWTRSNGSNTIVQVARSTDGGVTWSAVTDLSATTRSAVAPQVALNASGNAIVVWHRSNGTNTIIQESHSSNSGSTWSAPADLSATGQNATIPQIGLVGGVAFALWKRVDDTTAKTTIQAKRSADAGATWGSASDLSNTAQHAEDPQVALDGSGNAIVVWERSNGTKQVVQTARYTSSWSAASDLSDSAQHAYDPQLTSTAGGVAMAVWYRSNGTNTIVQAKRYSGSWGSTDDLSATGQDAQDVQVALDGSGNAYAVWARSNGTHRIIQAARYGGSWGSPVSLSAAGQDADAPQVAVASDGNVVATWYRSDGTDTVVQASRYTGSWDTAVGLSATGQFALDPQVAAGSAGSAVIIWYRTNGSNTIVQVRRFTVPESAPVPPPPPPRAGYCLRGKFLDLERDQPEVDRLYTKAVPAHFIHGKGITCDNIPAGYHLSGYAPESLHVPRDLYPYWVRT